MDPSTRQQLELFWEDVENNGRRVVNLGFVALVMEVINATFPFKMNTRQITALERSVGTINKYLTKNKVWYRKHTDSKDAPSMQEMALAAGIKNDFPSEDKDYDIYLYAALILLLLIRNDQETQELDFVRSNDAFLNKYGGGPEFSGLVSDDPATNVLRRYGYCMAIGKSVICPKQNKERLMKIASYLSDGAIYITGSGQSLATTRRSKLYEMITG